MTKDQQSIVDRLRYGLLNNRPVTLGANEVHIPMNAIEENADLRDCVKTFGDTLNERLNVLIEKGYIDHAIMGYVVGIRDLPEQEATP